MGLMRWWHLKKKNKKIQSIQPVHLYFDMQGYSVTVKTAL